MPQHVLPPELALLHGHPPVQGPAQVYPHGLPLVRGPAQGHQTALRQGLLQLHVLQPVQVPELVHRHDRLLQQHVQPHRPGNPVHPQQHVQLPQHVNPVHQVPIVVAAEAEVTAVVEDTAEAAQAVSAVEAEPAEAVEGEDKKSGFPNLQQGGQ